MIEDFEVASLVATSIHDKSDAHVTKNLMMQSRTKHMNFKHHFI